MSKSTTEKCFLHTVIGLSLQIMGAVDDILVSLWERSGSQIYTLIGVTDWQKSNFTLDR